LEQGADLERFAGLEPEDARRERAALWEERLVELAHAAKIDIEWPTRALRCIVRP
jgi:hypothetical protein